MPLITLSRSPTRLTRYRSIFWLALSGLFLLTAGMSSAAGSTTSINVTELTVRDVESGLRRQQYSAHQLAAAFLARIAIYNPGYNAIITFNPSALADADEIDRRRASGERLGPLAGVPIVVKDTMDVAGLPSTAGWARLSRRAGGVDLIPARSASVVDRLRAAGAIILGKTNVPILSVSGDHANDSWAGPTYNAAAPLRVPGASSAGTATAVAASFAVFGLGEETGGSIQNPAAAQALVGIKPTFALVPNDGVIPLANSTRDVVGPIARSVRDAALVLDALAGYTPADPKTMASLGHIPAEGYAAHLERGTLRGKRIGLYGPGWLNLPLSAETQALYREVVDQLQQGGATTVEDPFAGSDFAAIAERSGEGQYDQRGEESVAYDLQHYLEHLGPQAAARSLADLVALTREDPFSGDGILVYERVNPEFVRSLLDPSQPPDLTAFRALRARYLDVFETVMNAHTLDVLVYPQSLAEAPLLDSKASIFGTTFSEINIGGMPGIVVPAGYYRSGTPFGIILVGRAWDEASMLQIAYAYEQATHVRKAPKLVRRPAALQPPATN